MADGTTRELLTHAHSLQEAAVAQQQLFGDAMQSLVDVLLEQERLAHEGRELLARTIERLAQLEDRLAAAEASTKAAGRPAAAR